MAREVELESLIGFFDNLLEVEGFPDYGGAANGLQVEGPETVSLLAVAVDAAEYSIQAAVDRGADLLLVHHGLFWAGTSPVTGRLYRRLVPLIRSGMGLYSAHLPLDAHPEVGNCAELARALGFEPEERFGTHRDRDIGFVVEVNEAREDLAARAGSVLGGEVRLVPGGPERVGRLGIVTGGGAAFVTAAAAEGVDTLLTGEGANHTWVDAMELGVNVLLGGHYRTETWGVKALARRAEDEFGLPWQFLDFPTGF